MERQAMLYSNIIEQIKSGEEVSNRRSRFEGLGVLPGISLPNPNVPDLMQEAFDKISAFRKELVDVVKKYGGVLLNELNFELERSVSVGVNISF